MRTVKRIFGIVCLLLGAGVAHAQSDFGIWTSVEGSAKLNKKWELSLEGEYRTQDISSMTERMSGAVNLSYKDKRIPFLKADVGYTFMYMNYPGETNIKYHEDDNGLSTEVPKHMNVDAPYWTARHRLTASLTGTLKWGRFKCSLRERYQYTYRMPSQCNRERYDYNPAFDAWDEDPELLIDDKLAKSDHKLRSRFSVTYDIKKSPFEPYAELEIYNQFDENLTFDKVRYTVGTAYKINKEHKLKVYYRYQDYFDASDVDCHVFGMSYAFEF